MSPHTVFSPATSAAPPTPDDAAAKDAARRAMPFALVLALCALSPAVPHAPGPDPTLWLAAGAVIVVMFALGRLGAVTGRASLADAAPLLVAPAVALLRAADGSATSGFSPLLMLPILWYALYGNRRLLAAAFVEATLTLLAPIALVGAPQYPASTLRGALLLLAVMGSLGYIVQQLITAVGVAHRRATEDAARFHGVFEYAPVGMALSDGAIAPDSGFTTVNRTLCALLGRSPETLVNSTLRDLVQPPDLDGLVDHVSRGDGEPVEVRFAHRAGHTVWASVSCVSVQADAHAAVRHAWQIEDVTAQRAADASVLDLLDTERQAAKVLRETEREQRQLLASISHDLRTPITAALGFAELLADGEYGALSPSQQPVADTVTRSLGNLSRIINELVVIGPELARGEGLPQQHVSVDDLVVDAIQMISIQASLRDQSVDYEHDAADGLHVAGDQVRLGRMLSNLLANAVKFSPVGGRISVSTARDGDTAVICVADTGRGIAPADQERIFERFYRAPHHASDPTVRGSGLGLAIVKAIVVQHGGAISLRSAPGQGTTFVVRLPAVDAASHADVERARVSRR